MLGDKGGIKYGSHGAHGVSLFPKAKMKAYRRPAPTLPRIPGGHYQDWTDAIRAGKQAGSNFDYGGPLTELALLGVIALRFPNTKLQWDGSRARFANHEAANRWIDPPAREGWELG